MNNTVEKKKGGKILDVIETVGNKLPHPYIMFLWLCWNQYSVQPGRSSGDQSDNWRNCSGKSNFQQRWNCMAARKFTEKFSGLLSTWSGTRDADGNWIC